MPVDCAHLERIVCRLESANGGHQRLMGQRDYFKIVFLAQKMYCRLM